MQPLELNCKPIIVACTYPPELCDSEEASAIEDGWQAAAGEILRRGLNRVERTFLGLPAVESKLVDETPKITLMPLDEYRQLRGTR